MKMGNRSSFQTNAVSVTMQRLSDLLLSIMSKEMMMNHACYYENVGEKEESMNLMKNVMNHVRKCKGVKEWERNVNYLKWKKGMELERALETLMEQVGELNVGLIICIYTLFVDVIVLQIKQGEYVDVHSLLNCMQDYIGMKCNPQVIHQLYCIFP